ADLVATLSALATRGGGGTSSPLKSLRPADLRLQATALALSAMVWAFTFLFPGASVRVRSVPLEFTHVPPGLTVASQSRDTVEVWLRGNDFILDSLDLQSLAARCDLSGRREGE